MREDSPLQVVPDDLLGMVLEDSVNEIYLIDAHSLGIVFANRAARENLGYSPDEISALPADALMPEFRRSELANRIAALYAEDAEHVLLKTVLRRKNRSVYPVEAKVQLSALEGRPVVVAFILDVTNRVETLASLQQTRELFESAPDASVVVDQDGIIRIANTQATRLFGYSNAELVGSTIERLVPLRLRDKHVQHRREFAATPRVRAMGSGVELVAQTKSGNEVPIEVSLSPVETDEGRLTAAAIRDITARRQSDARLRAAMAEAERANSSKSRFLAAASHDLRQPLQSVGLYLSVALRKPEQLLDVGPKMQRSLDAMSELLDSLLDISRLDGGSIQADRKDFPIGELIDRVLAEAGPLANEKGLALESRGDSAIVHSDQALLQRIVENFVANAIKYTETGSVTIDCRREDDHLRLSIVDTGCGIPEASLERIFEEYYQLDNPARDRRRGFGLGLTIVKHVAALLGHELQVSSLPGKGSTFSVNVPLGTTAELVLKPPAATAEPPLEKSPVVLLIDDDAAIVDAMTMLLEASGFRVHRAMNGAEAYAQLDTGVRPDIVISDYRLPGENGLEVIDHIRTSTDSSLPSILITGDTAASEIRRSPPTDCEVLNKPVDTDRLLRLIRQSVS